MVWSCGFVLDSLLWHKLDTKSSRPWKFAQIMPCGTPCIFFIHSKFLDPKIMWVSTWIKDVSLQFVFEIIFWIWGTRGKLQIVKSRLSIYGCNNKKISIISTISFYDIFKILLNYKMYQNHLIIDVIGENNIFIVRRVIDLVTFHKIA